MTLNKYLSNSVCNCGEKFSFKIYKNSLLNGAFRVYCSKCCQCQILTSNMETLAIHEDIQVCEALARKAIKERK